MKVYVVLIQDRHADVDVEVFSDGEKAIERARSLAKEYCHDEGDLEEKQIADWYFHIEYSCESDFITVHEREVI